MALIRALSNPESMYVYGSSNSDGVDEDDS